MNILGIVAEYNPFHIGHAAHLEAARTAANADMTVIALSSCLTQRGEPAMLAPRERALCAVKAGADAVFEIPTIWTVRDAEHYALGAVSLLSALGCTHLAFGAETPEPDKLLTLSRLQDDDRGAFQTQLKKLLDTGIGYPAAYAGAAEEIYPGAADILSKPNNILAVSYLRAIRTLRSDIIPIPCQRTGDDRATAVDSVSPSASAVRNALKRGAWRDALRALPDYSAEALRNSALRGILPDQRVWDTLVLNALRKMDRESASRLPDISEGLSDRLTDAAAEAVSVSELIRRVSCRRYPASRVCRLCAYAALGITAEQLSNEVPPSSVRLLALKKTADPGRLHLSNGFRIFSRVSEYPDTFSFRTDLAAYRLYSLLCRRPGTIPYTDGVATA